LVFANPFGILANTNISYFVGVDVTNDLNPRMILSGDGNFALGGVPVKSGLLKISSNSPVAWTSARHRFSGNLGMADGSVQQVINLSLPKILGSTGVDTNRFAIP
jgi:prepilin-type processing-associated H-X9-DG protein